MINCFACDANFHIKCLGLNGNMADKISTDSGFHYYCENHKSLSVKSLLYKLSSFQKLNEKLKQLLDEFSELSRYRPEDLIRNLEMDQSNNVSSFSTKSVSKGTNDIASSSKSLLTPQQQELLEVVKERLMLRFAIYH
ncbi:hypothetical protein ACFFRR_005456 [Megaselia abdita]